MQAAGLPTPGWGRQQPPRPRGSFGLRVRFRAPPGRCKAMNRLDAQGRAIKRRGRYEDGIGKRGHSSLKPASSASPEAGHADHVTAV